MTIASDAAVRTLTRLGYEFHGGQEWVQPAQGKAVAWIHGDEYGDTCHWVGGSMPPAGTKLYTAPPAPSVPDDIARKVAIAEWVAQNSWWTYSAASEAVAKAERLAAPEMPS